MNFIDFVLFIILLVCVLAAVRRGFILSTLQLLSWLGSLVIGFIFCKSLSGVMLIIFPGIGVFSAVVSFVLIVIIARVLLDLLAARILQQTPFYLHTSVLNKILGIVPGLVDGYIWAALLAVFLLLMPFTGLLSREAHNSKLATGLAGKTGWLEHLLSPVFAEIPGRVIGGPGAERGEEKFTKLPFTVQRPEVQADLEAEMLRLVNNERTQRGMAPLKADPKLTAVARKHSVDMLARGYFSHYTPEGVDPFARMRNDDIHFLAAGENVALAPTLAQAHSGLMHSPGHRANILNPAFGRVGIGIEDGGIYGLMITQDFRN